MSVLLYNAPSMHCSNTCSECENTFQCFLQILMSVKWIMVVAHSAVLIWSQATPANAMTVGSSQTI